MQLQTCLWLVVTDASGRRLDLAPGAHAELSFKMPATLVAERPATIPFVRFDDATGRWAENGIARLQGDRYVARVAHLGSAGITFFNGGACLRIQVHDNSLERPFYLKIIDSNDGSSGTVFVTQKLTPVYGLRQKTYHFLQVMPKSNPTHIITTALVYTDANVTGPASPPFPYSSCKTVTLKATLPSKSWLTRSASATRVPRRPTTRRSAPSRPRTRSRSGWRPTASRPGSARTTSSSSTRTRSGSDAG